MFDDRPREPGDPVKLGNSVKVGVVDSLSKMGVKDFVECPSRVGSIGWDSLD